MDAPLLDALCNSDLTLLLDRAVRRDLCSGDVLHLAGDRPDRVHLIERGIVKLTSRDSEGEETILGLATPGTVCGDLAAVDGRRHPVDAVAATAVSVIGFDAPSFLEVVMRNPEAALELARIQAARTRWMADIALERTSGEASARIAGRLLDLGRMLGTERGQVIEMELPLGQRDLGKLAGVCRESTCKTLRKLKADGVVDYRGRRLRILRPDSLRMMRCGAGD
ncbi:MAG: family transcriptional regulator, cyclic receptor protein [Actinomycetota bacterium]|jgi:CRP-like cAMP-binding protein|nr:family transcriptional regulator, cyclic receptor protein [Actinomycetota bacterium]